MVRNSLNVLKMSNNPWKFPNFNMKVVFLDVNGKKMPSHKRKSMSARHQTYIFFPLGTTSLLVRCSDLWEVCAKTFNKHDKFFTMASWYHFMTSSKVSCISDHFWIFWNLQHRTLTWTQGHKYDFSTHDGLLFIVHVVQIWITPIIWLETQLMS